MASFSFGNATVRVGGVSFSSEKSVIVKGRRLIVNGHDVNPPGKEVVAGADGKLEFIESKGYSWL